MGWQGGQGCARLTSLAGMRPHATCHSDRREKSASAKRTFRSLPAVEMTQGAGILPEKDRQTPDPTGIVGDGGLYLWCEFGA